MRHRIHVDRIEPVVTVTGDEFHHSARVVRVRPGEEVELFDGAGNGARGAVESIDRDRLVVTVTESVASRESPLAIHLAMAVIALERFELVLQKATELGARTIIPLVTERGEVRRERYSGKVDRWERIVLEAVKQSGRTLIPRIEPAIAFPELVARNGAKIVFDADTQSDAIERMDEVTLLVGPEGGWSEDELRMAREGGCLFQRLGPRRLRAETAAIAALSVITSRFGDL